MGEEYRKDFGSLGEFIGFLKTAPVWDGRRSSESTDDASFYGKASLPEAYELALRGWPEGTKSMGDKIKDIHSLTETNPIPLVSWDVAGYLPDVPRAVAGVPDCMFNYGDELTQRKPVVKLMVNTSTSGSNSIEQITRRGAVLVDYIDRLEASGQRVELVAYEQSKSCGKVICLTVVVKRAQDVLDLDTVAFCLSHPAFLRRLSFRFTETSNWYSDFGFGYGSPLDIPYDKLEPGCVHIGHMGQGECCTDEQAVEALTRQIEGQLKGGASV